MTTCTVVPASTRTYAALQWTGGNTEEVREWARTRAGVQLGADLVCEVRPASGGQGGEREPYVLHIEAGEAGSALFADLSLGDWLVDYSPTVWPPLNPVSGAAFRDSWTPVIP